jgi:hypothetical protein
MNIDSLKRAAEQLDPPMWFDAEDNFFGFEDEEMAYYYIEQSHQFVLHYPNRDLLPTLHYETGFF